MPSSFFFGVVRIMTSHFQRILASGILALTSAMAVDGAEPPRVVEHVQVYDFPGRFGGWPANQGAWIWENEILVGFSEGEYKDLGGAHYDYDRTQPEENILARSLDGGHIWSLEYPGRQHVLVGTKGMRKGTIPPGQSEPEPVDCPGGIDFTHPDFAMTLRFEGVQTGSSRFYYSYDRGKTWNGPFRLSHFGQKGIAARTDFIVNNKHDAFFFLTASKSNNREGRVICGRTTDGGKTFEFVSYVGPEPNGFSIMPSTLRLSETDMLCMIRRRSGPMEKERGWIESWRTHDNGNSWVFDQDVAETGEGNPPHLIRLKDGRLSLTYGFRAAPFAMHARFSSDEGKSWTEPFILDRDAACLDIGYPRTVQRPDGKLVTIYYVVEKQARKVTATIWDPGTRGRTPP